MTQQEIDSLKQSLISLINSKLADQSTIMASEHRDVENAIVDSIFTDKSLKGDIKEIAVLQSYIAANFEPSSSQFEGRALPNSERAGWAICNGKNGTVDKRGNVSIGYDPVNYPLLTLSGANGAVGGAKTHTLSVTEMPPHTHSRPRGNDNNLNYGASPARYGWQAIDDAYGDFPTSSTGGQNGITQAHNNMQPYIVTLFIQKIS
jgi:hypothetical protein